MVEVSLEENPSPDSSVLHPLVKLVTIAARESLLQAAVPQTLVSQVSMGPTIEVFPPEAPVTRGIRDDGLKHAEAGLMAIVVNADVHCCERLKRVSPSRLIPATMLILTIGQIHRKRQQEQ
jgi:hypothetical protein